MRVRTAMERSAAATLLGLAGLHAVWGLGSSWPAADHEELADVVAGRPGGAVPPATACFAVAALLAAASTLVAGRPIALPRARRAGAAGVAAVLAARGTLGIAGRTDLVSPGSSSPRFRRLDRRWYSPLCLLLAAAAASSAGS